MKKIILLVLFVSFCWPAMLFSEKTENKSQVKTENFLTDYRFNPFQWIYPEYFYKADIIPVKKEKLPSHGYTKVEFFGLTACIPSKNTEEITRKHDIMRFKSKAGDTIMMIKSLDNSYICLGDAAQAYQKDYCSAYKTPQELYHKLYTLTPDAAKNMGDKWIVHGKGELFVDTKKIEIYSGDKFIAYVKFIKDSLVKETRFSHEITLFHVNGPMNSHVTISFLAKDDTILNHFISTIE